jgi:Tol biopolymer transport system component
MAGDSSVALADSTVKQVSLTRRGDDPRRESYDPSTSGDGRFVAFQSYASDLVPGDRNRSADIFVFDMRTGTTVRASVDTLGGDPDGDSYEPSISSSGRYVAFWSGASDLVAGDGNLEDDVFVRDLEAGITVRASVDTGGGDPDDGSHSVSISADGRFVAFQSRASDLVAGDENGLQDIFVRDLVAGTTVRASVDTGDGDPNSESEYAAISGDGRYVGFATAASDLVLGDGNGFYDVFVRDLQAGSTVRASVDWRGGDPDGSSFKPAFSADGRFVAFESTAPDLVAGDGCCIDLFVRDLMAGTTIRASVDTEGGDPNAGIFGTSISADGRYVAFDSDASDLVAGDGNGALDVFIRDVVDGITVRVSVDMRGGDPDGWSAGGSLSRDGHYVAFQSTASDLTPGSSDKSLDVFISRW